MECKCTALHLELSCQIHHLKKRVTIIIKRNATKKLSMANVESL